MKNMKNNMNQNPCILYLLSHDSFLFRCLEVFNVICQTSRVCVLSMFASGMRMHCLCGTRDYLLRLLIVSFVFWIEHVRLLMSLLLSVGLFVLGFSLHGTIRVVRDPLCSSRF